MRDIYPHELALIFWLKENTDHASPVRFNRDVSDDVSPVHRGGIDGLPFAHSKARLRALRDFLKRLANE